MTMDVKHLQGLFLLFGLIYSASAQSIANCKTYGTENGVIKCLECTGPYSTNSDRSHCCSTGCRQDNDGFHLCNITTDYCIHAGCLPTFYGPTCEPCSNGIQLCDSCAYTQQRPDVLTCLICGTGYDITTNQEHCCLPGCDACDGDNCTVCKSSYYLYNQRCDICGDNCKQPDDRSARCNPTTGECILGCNDGWHGLTCEVECNLQSCDLCAYNDEILTCADCEPGYYGDDCKLCGNKCLPSTTGELCYQDGTCVAAGCSPGYRGNKCNTTCDAATNMVNCNTCERYDFMCTSCVDGYWGDVCQNSCNVHCVTYQGSRKCSIKEGTCSNACNAGYYQHNCSGSCPNCANDICVRETGDCLDPICLPGYHGSNCNFTCPSNCAPDPDTLDAYCSILYGNCTHGCREGKWGSFCDRGCSSNCAPSPSGMETGPLCAQQDGSCDYACNPHHYKQDCSSTCISECVDDTCDINNGKCSACDPTEGPPGYLCPSGTCTDGKYGQFCQSDCTDNCFLTCGRYNGSCFGCDRGYHGNSCELTCGHCSSGTCDQKTGMCISDCSPGYWNAYCNQTCLRVGCSTCFKTNGECDVCDVGLYEANCDKNCSVFCARNSLNSVTCDKVTGTCDEGRCLPGYWNYQCDRACSDNCRENSNLERTCFLDTGDCIVGCEATLYGGHCNFPCSPACTSKLCDRDGACSISCVNGAYGERCADICSETCNDETCDRNNGRCEECDKTFEERTPLCRNANCDPINTWGLFCRSDCPDNCGDGTCTRDNGTCNMCKDKTHGVYCSKDCSNCLNNKCYQIDGVCIAGCVDGWYNLTCTTQCKHDGCQNCDRATGECITCKEGFYGNNCSSTCARTCAEDSDGVITCNRFSGECDMKACKAGYYTAQCTETCSEYCESAFCDLDAGTCDACIQGWYGQKCVEECSSRCKNNDCVALTDNCRQDCTDGYWGSRCEKFCNDNCDNKACSKDTAECVFGCTGSFFYELTCDEPCGGKCIDGMCNRTGYCLKGCQVGWFGEKCQFQCLEVSKCTNGECSRIDGSCGDCFNIISPGPNCPTAECPSGKRGNDCDDDCSSTNCLYNQCGRYTDECIACPTGAFGNLCQDRCTHCIEGTGCDQTSGECINGCSDGWYGLVCQTECAGVCKSCERQSGTCITCAAGRWGDSCGLICSSNCVETQEVVPMVHCDKITGACDEGACKISFWRADCTQVCSNNCLQDSNNNRICAYLDGKCSNGCKETFYGQTCDDRCSIRCRDQLCTDFEDSCDTSCADGYYGSTCPNTCSTHCAGLGKCNPETGNCNEGCELSYYGPRCDDPCKNTCLDGTCDDTGGCYDCNIIPVGPNCRAQVCPAGQYGPTCESNCPGSYCRLNQCHRKSGTCADGCLTGYYGGYCTEECQCHVAGTDLCEQEKGKCTCKLGIHGTLCDKSCSDGCSGFECEQDGTCSVGCITGRYGATCDQQCTNCFNEDCNAGTGNCQQGCVEGWFGPQCKSRCPTECKACDVQSGACLSCSTNYYSLPLCDEVCSNNCKQMGSGRMCNQVDGVCLSGCKNGYYNSDCGQSCGNCDSCDPSDGACVSCHFDWWGRTCKAQCSSTCVREGPNKECRQTDGYCVSGCVSGYFGERCSEICASTNCDGGGCDRQAGTCTSGCVPYFYGSNCKSRCDQCKEGRCNQNTGYCVGDCPLGYYGNRCEDTCRSLCVDSTCIKDTGYCTDCQLSPKGTNCMVQDPVTVAPTTAATSELSVGAIVAITSGSVAFVVIFVIVFVCCMNYKRRYDDAKTEIHLPSDVIERMSTHRSLHSSVSANYPVARVVGDDEKDFVLF